MYGQRFYPELNRKEGIHLRRITLLERPQCSLCEEVYVWLTLYQDDYGFEVERKNIEDDDRLHEIYAMSIPVVRIAGNEHELTARELDLASLESFLKNSFS